MLLFNVAEFAVYYPAAHAGQALEGHAVGATSSRNWRPFIYVVTRLSLTMESQSNA